MLPGESSEGAREHATRHDMQQTLHSLKVKQRFHRLNNLPHCWKKNGRNWTLDLRQINGKLFFTCS